MISKINNTTIKANPVPIPPILNTSAERIWDVLIQTHKILYVGFNKCIGQTHKMREKSSLV
ncbi:hypothetical protein J6TS1_06990 [Siminovitchia terrae]|uniref:Uncharacterized protein n=1 Tax=Siminovitchia terrae TaxID=1914933 RepID=A0ABQ4KT59_SIMTE|nr:hypothetical protein J22TS1_23050 [Siminovitchia terrae]GIN94829.1 hypothetical protein J6TS1_06990 [Siminovitchia terrae]